MVSKKDREYITYLMTDTGPSLAGRLHRILDYVGLDFGSEEDLEWGALREASREIIYDSEAVASINRNVPWPPVGAKRCKQTGQFRRV